ncbi:MAG: hypothetical protein KJ718_00135 [Nanoarchaeota archaeon]|nr:hypothetical protein [Nanoarchaeota archaeon]MBU1988270.1 hypothetical protein [Nanoarchaeota archaeon]
MIPLRKLKKTAIVTGFSLITLLTGCPFTKSDTSGLPANDQKMGRTMALYEGDIQNDPDQTLSTSFSVPFACLPTGVNVEVLPDREGRAPPFDASFTGETEVGPEGRTTKVGVDITDNDEPYISGQYTSLRISTVTASPVFPHVDYRQHLIGVQYHHGISGETTAEELEVIRESLDDLGDQVEQNTGGIIDLIDDLSEHENQTVPPAHTPELEPEPPQPPLPPQEPIIGDDICGPGETWLNSIDCEIPSSAWAGTGVAFYEGDTHLNPDNDSNWSFAMAPASERHLTARFSIPSDLEAALAARGIEIPQGTVRQEGYHEGSQLYDGDNNPDCFYTANVGTTYFIGEENGVSQWGVDFDLVHSGCTPPLEYDPQTIEQIATRYDFGEGVFYEAGMEASVENN